MRFLAALGLLAACGGDAVEKSPGCGLAASAGESARTVMVAGVARGYLLVIPPGYDPARPHHLVFGWHGAGSNGADFRHFTGQLVDDAGEQAISVFPDGLPVDGGASGWDLAADGVDVQLFDAVLAQVSGELCVDLGRIETYGYSFGGGMVQTLACARGNQLAGVAGIEGFIADKSCVSGPVPMFLWHNMDDPTVGFDRFVDEEDHWSAANDCSPATTPIAPAPCQQHSCGQAPLVTCNPPDGGHGFDPQVVLPAIWSFFR